MNQAIIILSVLFFTSTIMCIAMGLAWLHFGRQRHAATWAFAFGLGALQWVVNAAGVITMPGSPLPIIIASSIVVFSSSLVVIGARQRARLPAAWGKFAVAAAIAVVAITIIYTILDNTGLRAAFTNLYAAVMMPLAATATLARKRKSNVPEITFAVMLLIFSLYQLILGLVGLGMGPHPEPPALDRYRLTLGIGLPAVYVGAGVAALFLLAGDLSESVRALVTRDPLTGSLNRRGIEQAATIAMANARRHESDLTVVVGDIDRFKLINDRMGHVAGDRALVAFADHVQASVREEDLFGRLGGDEFCLILTDTSLKDAADVIERIRQEIASLEIEGPPRLSLTASFGIAAFLPTDLSFADTLIRADTALYESKAGGRNCCTVAQQG